MRRTWSLSRAARWAGVGLALEMGLGAVHAQVQQTPGRFIPDTGNMAQPTAGSQEVDVTRPYAIGPHAGTWLICAASFTGPYAPSLAVQLVEEVRHKHGMPAYIFNHANEERLRLLQEEEAAQRAAEAQGIPRARRRIRRVDEQCAVLVGGPRGGWQNIDDATAFMKKVRGWDLPQLRLDNGRPAYEYSVELRAPVGRQGSPTAPHEVVKHNAINPFQTSFVTHNPTIPAEKPRNKYDPAWEKFNRHEDYSLLRCPKPWTLAVKEYAGGMMVQPTADKGGFLDKIGLGGLKAGEGITAAGYQAHELASFLQKLGFQPYVLHTRTSSIVTIGAFSGPDDPEMGKIQDRLARFSFARDGGQPYNLGLFARPLPMEVPHP